MQHKDHVLFYSYLVCFFLFFLVLINPVLYAIKCCIETQFQYDIEIVFQYKTHFPDAVCIEIDFLVLK